MTPAEHITRSLAAGKNITQAVRHMAHICCCSERIAWRLRSGEKAADPAHLILLELWHTCPHLRHHWRHNNPDKQQTP